MITYKEFIKKQTLESTHFEEEGSLNESSKLFSAGAWMATRKKIKNKRVTIEDKLVAVVDLIAMSTYLTQREVTNLESSLVKALKKQ